MQQPLQNRKKRTLPYVCGEHYNNPAQVIKNC